MIPSLEYRLDGFARGAVGLPGEPNLYRVRSVAAFMIRDELHIYARGPMLRKKDGLPGPNRSSRVDIDAEQPDWLVDVLDDIDQRLPEAAL